jgi:hypothetical protein
MINIEIKLSNSNSLIFNCILKDHLIEERRLFEINNPPVYITSRIMIKSISYKCHLDSSQNCYLKLNLTFGNHDFSVSKKIDLDLFKSESQIYNEIQSSLELILNKEDSLLNIFKENKDYDFKDIESLA